MLFQAITERQHLFDSFLLPKLQEELHISQSAAKTIQTVLIKKGVLHDDPYNYDSKITEIQIPPEDPYTEAEKPGIIGRRLAQYEAMLDFLNNYYLFTCDFLNTDRIGKLVALNRTFNWESFSTTSNRVNTKGLADLVNNIRTGTDPLSISIINDSLTQLSKSSIAQTKALKGLTEFHRERYKIAVRKLVMPGIAINPEAGTTAAIKDIKRSFSVSMKEQPFYTELIEEILKEDYSPDHAVLQQELLAKLSVTKPGNGKAAMSANLKNVLLDGLRTIGSASPQLDEICQKLQENQHLLDNMEKGFFQKLSKALRKAFNRPEEEQEIAISNVDPVTQATKRENILFTKFIEEVKRRSRVYTGFTVRASASFQKIEAMEDALILDLLTRNVAELSNLLKQLAGVDEYFKQTAPSELRERVRGIKVELSAIRNNLVKANQCRAEYASQVEEQQQLKKLGITNV